MQQKNVIRLTGRTTKDIRTNVVQDTPVANFSLAVNHGLIGKKAVIDGREQIAYVEGTSYFECAAWGPEALACADLDKGQEVTVTIDSLTAKAYEKADKSGHAASLNARVSNVVLGAKPKGARAPVPAGAAQGEEEIPF